MLQDLYKAWLAVLFSIVNSHIPVLRYVHTIVSCFQWSNHSLSSFFLKRCLHLSTCMFYWFVPLYMLNSWCRMYIVYTQFYLRFLDLYLVAYMDFCFWKTRWHLFTNSVFCIIKLVMWIPFANSVVWIGIFPQHHIRLIWCCFAAYNYTYFIVASVCVSARACACAYIAVYACIYSRTIAVPANVHCWI